MLHNTYEARPPPPTQTEAHTRMAERFDTYVHLRDDRLDQEKKVAVILDCMRCVHDDGMRVASSPPATPHADDGNAETKAVASERE